MANTLSRIHPSSLYTVSLLFSLEDFQFAYQAAATHTHTHCLFYRVKVDLIWRRTIRADFTGGLCFNWGSESHLEISVSSPTNFWPCSNIFEKIYFTLIWAMETWALSGPAQCWIVLTFENYIFYFSIVTFASSNPIGFSSTWSRY